MYLKPLLQEQWNEFIVNFYTPVFMSLSGGVQDCSAGQGTRMASYSVDLNYTHSLSHRERGQ